jgi:FKBP-type peptidyl-prolyl cis-trans isomerase FkpA
MRGFSLLLPAFVVLQAAGQTTTTAPAKPKAASTSTSTAPKAPVHKTITTTKPTVTKPTTAPALTTDEQKTIYALGLSIHHSLLPFSLSPAEFEIINRALTDAAAGKPAEDISVWGPKIQGLAQAREAVTAQKAKADSKLYLDKAAGQPGAVKSPSGLIYRELRPGTGAFPKASDTVKVNYRGTLLDGTEFDSSYKRNEPATFPLSNVIRCWTEGVQKMKVGGKAELVCPSDIAYGDRGNQGIPGGATLIFEIELLEIGGAAH